LREEPLCFILDIDDFRILLDCGTTDDFLHHEEIVDKVRRSVDFLSCVLPIRVTQAYYRVAFKYSHT
jgi:hypothetical protein